MPRVPGSPLPSVSLSAGPSTSFSSEAVTSRSAQLGGQQMQQFGQAMQGAGQAGASLYAKELDRVNTIRVVEAENKARQAALDLSYGQETGFRNLKGLQALERPDGMDLTTEYARKLDEQVSSIAGSLSNDAQKQAFNQRAANLSNSFREQTASYQLSEFREYSKSQIEGKQKLAIQTAGMAWSDPAMVEDSRNSAREAIYLQTQTMGMSANEAEAMMRETDSQIHQTVITSALSAGNAAYAADYFSQNRKGMTALDILKVEGLVNTAFDKNMAGSLTAAAEKQAQEAFKPSDMGRLVNVIMQAESNGQRYGADGKMLESPKGAKGEMQVMDATNRDPGFGVTPAKDDSPAERARVGQEYIGAMVQRYGSLEKAAAAYNAGPGNVDKALADAQKAGTPNDWMKFLPKPEETVPYVQKVVKNYKAGQGAAALPTKEDFVKLAITPLGEAARPELVAATREAAEKRYADLVEDRKQRGDQALQEAQRILISNNGDFNAIPAELQANLAAVDPKLVEDARKFSKAVGSEIETNTAAYTQAVTEPGVLARMSDAQFTQYVTTNFSDTDRKEIAKLRADVISGKVGPNAAPDVVNLVTQRWDSMNPSASKDKREAALNDSIYFVRQMVSARQQEANRPLSSVEQMEIVDRYFETSVFQSGMVYGKNATPLAELEYNDIPVEDRLRIAQDLSTLRGGSVPSQNAVLRVFKLRQMGQ